MPRIFTISIDKLRNNIQEESLGRYISIHIGFFTHISIMLTYEEIYNSFIFTFNYKRM